MSTFPGEFQITTREQLAKALPGQSDIANQVDLTREYLLLFVWEGSGGDTLTFKVTENKETPVVTFSYGPGEDDDLRPHYHLYVIRNSAELVIKAPLFARLPWDQDK